MTNKHTPGPWYLRTPYHMDTDHQYIGSDSRERVAVCHTEADARLIAAAPETAAERDWLKEINAELLAALRDVLPHVPLNDRWAVRAAIAKATGQALQELADIGQELNI